MITGLTVLYDAGCGLCRTARSWLAARAQLVPLEFVPAGSEEARRRYPALDPADTLADITVVASDGGVYTGDGAWLICLWALDGYRGLAARLAEPGMRPVARQVVATAAAVRKGLRRTDPQEPGRDLFDRGYDDGWTDGWADGFEQGEQSYRRDCGGTCDI